LQTRDVLLDAFGRIREAVHEVLEGLGPEQLSFRADPEANSIAWLVWHLTRVQDDHVWAVAGGEQVWVAEGWDRQFALPLAVPDTGYGHTAEQVGKVRSSAALLTGYHDAVFERTAEFVTSLTSDDLDRVVDRRWDPPVTLAVRLVSVVGDDLQHIGQAAFVRGMVERGAGA